MYLSKLIFFFNQLLSSFYYPLKLYHKVKKFNRKNKMHLVTLKLLYQTIL